MMAFEQPILIAFVARLDDVKINLAAFGVAASFAMIVEAPIIMLLSASTALVSGRASYKMLKKFADILNAAITTLQLIILIPPVFNFIVVDVMSIPEEVACLAHTALIIFLPWAASIGYRRFYQGILIRNNHTRRVTYGTMVRLIVIIVMGLILFLSGVKGAFVGAGAMSSAVFLEAIATRLMATGSIKSVLRKTDDGNNLNLKSIALFYYPLALTSILSIGIQPFVTFFLGRSRMALESLAVLPVVNSLIFIFRSPGLSYQEATIALIGDKKQHYHVLKRFAILMGMIVTFLISLLAFTSLADIWFINVSGLTGELAGLSYLPLQIMILLPVLTVMLNFQRAMLISNGTTAPISVATAIELGSIIVLLLTAVVFLNFIGVVAAAIALTIGKMASNAYLVPKSISLTAAWFSARHGR